MGCCVAPSPTPSPPPGKRNSKHGPPHHPYLPLSWLLYPLPWSRLPFDPRLDLPLPQTIYLLLDLSTHLIWCVVSMWSQRSQYTYLLSISSRILFVYLYLVVCHHVMSYRHVSVSCHTVILHMSSCHVSTCHDIVSYHIHYQYQFTFVT